MSIRKGSAFQTLREPRQTQIKYIGGGSFGYVYKAELPVMPYTLTVKACRVAGMQHNESAALKKLAERSLVHIPEVYFTFDATDEIPMDFIIEEFVNGTDCFTDFSKLFLSKRRKSEICRCNSGLSCKLAQRYLQQIRQPRFPRVR